MDIKQHAFTAPAQVMPEDSIALQRQMRLAQMLQQQAQTPLNPAQMVGNRVVPIGLGEGLAKMLQGYFAGSAQDKAERMTQEALARQADQRQAGIQSMFGGSDIPPEIQAGLASRDPFVQQLAMSRLKQLQEPQTVPVGRSLLDKRTGKVVGTDQTWTEEQTAARQAKEVEARQKAQDRLDQITMQMEDRKASREQMAELRREQMALQRQLASQASADRMAIAGMVNARAEQKNTPKLPTSALKMQQEELDAIGTASSINADLAAFDKQIADGQLKLGAVSNILAKGKNIAGMSDESSRNLASFQSTLERLRNDSLRLNKGVQTEGDAQRAWNELIANINDPKLVRQRLGEIQKINERAVNLRRMNIDNIRSNFGVEAMDASGYKNQPAAVGGQGAPNVDELLKKYGGK